MTLEEAALAGLRRVRLPHWPPTDYMVIDILIHDDGYPLCGPWGKIYTTRQLTIDGLDRPQIVWTVSDFQTAWVPYTGPPVAGERPIVDERGRDPFED